MDSAQRGAQGPMTAATDASGAVRAMRAALHGMAWGGGRTAETFSVPIDGRHGANELRIALFFPTFGQARDVLAPRPIARAELLTLVEVDGVSMVLIEPSGLVHFRYGPTIDLAGMPLDDGPEIAAAAEAIRRRAGRVLAGPRGPVLVTVLDELARDAGGGDDD